MTLRQAIIKALEAEGWRQVPDASRRYVKLEHFVAAERLPLWVGKAGALRRGRTIRQSVPVNELWRRELISTGLG